MRKVSLLTVAALIALNGCATPSMHTSASSSIHPSSDVNPTRNVLQEPATYALKSLDNPTAAPLITVNLARGDQVGFQRESSGALVAVAGKATIPLDNGTYGWVIVESPKTTTQRANNELTALVLDHTKEIIVVSLCVVAVTAIVLVAICHGAPIDL